MKNSCNIIILSLIIGSLSAFSAQAFFPIPVPLIGNDIANNAADLGENLNAIGEQAEQIEATIQKTVEEVKSGSFGFEAIKSYTETLKKIDFPRLIPETKSPKDVAKNINDADKASAAIGNLYLNTYSEDGNHMEQAKKNQQKQTELLQMNVSAMYAHALATRVNLAKEREMPETTLDSKNTREIIQGNRAMAEKIVKRWNDILFMESQIAEYKSTQILTSITLDSQKTEARKGNASEGDNQ